MSSLHRQAMDSVLEAAALDVRDALKEYGIKDRHSEEADEAILDVAILHGYRVFVRIAEAQGLSVDAGLFADLAVQLADEMAEEVDEPGA